MAVLKYHCDLFNILLLFNFLEYVLEAFGALLILLDSYLYFLHMWKEVQIKLPELGKCKFKAAEDVELWLVNQILRELLIGTNQPHLSILEPFHQILFRHYFFYKGQE